MEGKINILSCCSIPWFSYLLVQQVVEEQLLILCQTPGQPNQWLLWKGSLEGEEGDGLLWWKGTHPSTTHCQSCLLPSLCTRKNNKLRILPPYPVCIPGISSICFLHRKGSMVLSLQLKLAKFTSWHLLLADSNAAEQVDSPYFSFPLSEPDIVSQQSNAMGE